MAYARYGNDSKYYVFWHESKDPPVVSPGTVEKQTLAVWHEDHRAESEGTLFSYAQVACILESGDFTVIAGFQPEDESFLRPLLEEFVRDVTNECNTES